MMPSLKKTKCVTNLHEQQIPFEQFEHDEERNKTRRGRVVEVKRPISPVKTKQHMDRMKRKVRATCVIAILALIFVVLTFFAVKSMTGRSSSFAEEEWKCVSCRSCTEFEKPQPFTKYSVSAIYGHNECSFNTQNSCQMMCYCENTEENSTIRKRLEITSTSPDKRIIRKEMKISCNKRGQRYYYRTANLFGMILGGGHSHFDVTIEAGLKCSLFEDHTCETKIGKLYPNCKRKKNCFLMEKENLPCIIENKKDEYVGSGFQTLIGHHFLMHVARDYLWTFHPTVDITFIEGTNIFDRDIEGRFQHMYSNKNSSVVWRTWSTDQQSIKLTKSGKYKFTGFEPGKNILVHGYNLNRGIGSKLCVPKKKRRQ